MQWLAISLVVSVVLTVVLNVLMRLFPKTTEGAATRIEELARQNVGDGQRGRSTVLVPWRAMLLGSLLLTLALNVALWLR